MVMKSGSADTSVESALTASRPVCWRGRGDLLQATWANPPKGTFLLVELWSGVSGLAVAMLSVGMHFYGAAAELDSTARACATEAMPNIYHYTRVEDVAASHFRGLLARRKPRAVILGGGSPCQGNSALNRNRQGLGDERSLQPSELRRLISEFQQLPEMDGVDLILFLENVASMPKEVLQTYSQWLQSSPVLIDAALMGWVARKRLYWMASLRRCLSADTVLPSGWECLQTSPLYPEFRFVGPKPFPSKIAWEQGFTPLFNAADVVAARGHGAMHTFTREFRHPRDRIAQASPAAAERFECDQRRFPPTAYEEHSLLWRNDKWRVPSPSERAEIMGLPPGLLRPVAGSQDQRVQAQNSLVGNGFHIPSVMLLLCLIPQLLQAKFIPYHMDDVHEVALHRRLQGTVWQPGRIEVFPGILDAAQILPEIQSQFLEFTFPDQLRVMTTSRLQACRLSWLQYFTAWTRSRGGDWECLGPSLVLPRDRSKIFAGLGTQRYPGDSKRGLDHLLPPGLGKETHIIEALKMPSPFLPMSWPEPDLQFVVEMLVAWQEFLPRFLDQCHQVFCSVIKAIAPLETWVGQHRSSTARLVASSKQPVAAATMVALLRWPDRDLAGHLLQGFPIVGTLPPTGLFRPLHPSDEEDPQAWLGDSAVSAVDELMCRRPPAFAEDIVQITIDEHKKGFCSDFLTRGQLDACYGRGQWRAIPRFLIRQADGKLRAIDNGRRSQHNEMTDLGETITTVNVDLIASIGRMLTLAFGDPLPEWLTMRLSTDDLPDAYRGLAVQPSQMRFSNIAVFVPDEGWRFVKLFGLAFGLASAVISFNRVPALGIAISRRCLGAISASYFDDQLGIEAVRDCDLSRRAIQRVFKALGAPPHPEKSFAPAPNRHYLGTSVHVGDFATSGIIRFQPKRSTCVKICALLSQVLSSGMLPSDQAGKLRGDLNWMYSNCAGQLGKLAGPVLATKQAGGSPELASGERLTLELLASLLQHIRPRDVDVSITPRQPVVIYSDASFEHGKLRLGWILFHPSFSPTGGTCQVPDEVLGSWKARDQQIFPGETFCGLLVPWLHPSLLRGQDCLWFIDNVGAVSALIRATSSQEDVHLVAQFASVLGHALQTRIWYEWIDSESNPSDGLSRDGLDDQWTLAQPWDVAEYAFPHQLLPGEFFQSFCSFLE